MCVRGLICFSLHSFYSIFLHFSRHDTIWRTAPNSHMKDRGCKISIYIEIFCKRRRTIAKEIRKMKEIRSTDNRNNFEWNRRKKISVWRQKNEHDIRLRNIQRADLEIEFYQMPNFFWINNKSDNFQRFFVNCGVGDFSQ